MLERTQFAAGGQYGAAEPALGQAEEAGAVKGPVEPAMMVAEDPQTGLGMYPELP